MLPAVKMDGQKQKSVFELESEKKQRG